MQPTAEKEAVRRDRSALESALRDAGAKVRGSQSSCPFHDDATPSGSVFQDGDGVWRFKCHAAACAFHGDVFDIQAKVAGKKPGDLLSELFGRRPEPRPADPDEQNLRVYPTLDALKAGSAGWEATYVYAHPGTRQPEMVVLRIKDGDRKRFLQARPQGGGFVMRAPPKPWPIYNRTRLGESTSAVVVEGEKCVHALTAVLPAGIAATTSPGGAGKAQYADWSPLAGKQVYLWPDKDDAGRQHMQAVADILNRLDPPADVRVIDPDNLGVSDAGDDVVEYLAAFGGSTLIDQKKAIEVVLERAVSMGPTSELRERIEDIIAGRYATVEFPWGCLSRLTQALLPGTVTLVCGDPGAAKSFLILQAMLYWHKAGVPVSLFELEENRPFWLMRTLALASGESALTDMHWVAANASAARSAYATAKPLMDGFGRRLFCQGDKQMMHGDLLAMIREQAAAGARVIAVDPMTALQGSERPWIDDLRFMMDAKAVIGRYGCSLILVTHPRIRRGKGGPSLDEMAGGAAFPRFAQTVLWIERPAKGKTVSWMDKYRVPGAGRVNRIVQIHKARNASGGGVDVAFQFDGATLEFREKGMVIEDAGDSAATGGVPQ